MVDQDEKLIFLKLQLFISSIKKYCFAILFYLLHKISILKKSNYNKTVKIVDKFTRVKFSFYLLLFFLESFSSIILSCFGYSYV